MPKAILIVSFGTTVAETRAKNITAVERLIEENFPDIPLYSAWTSDIIRRVMAGRGETVPDVTEALKKMSLDGITEVAVLPTHLLYGDEYDKLSVQAKELEHLFYSVRLARPLLAGQYEMKAVLDAVADGLPVAEDEALVLMGHGTSHFCNTVYGALDYLAKAEGRPYIFVGTVEAYPNLDTVLAAVMAAGYRKAIITPMMLVAGNHAINDMAGDNPESWQSRFTAAGIECRTVVRGLGEYEAIGELYLRHLKEALSKRGE